MLAPRLVKYEGLGNDFLVVERPGGLRDDEADAALALRLCDRHFGLGADGLLFVDPVAPSMHVVNADGSIPEMCGNGLRCVALHYARRRSIGPPEGRETLTLDVDTGAGPHRCVVERDGDDAEVAVSMAVPSTRPEDLSLARGHATGAMLDEPVTLEGRSVPFTAVSMGNPHAVTFEPVGDARLTLGPAMQRAGVFPRGVNVGFVSAIEPGPDGLARGFRLDVLERGAGWTLACGTGACAAGVAAVETGRATRGVPLSVELPGGRLEITVRAPGERVHMKGPARWVADVALSPRLWRKKEGPTWAPTRSERRP